MEVLYELIKHDIALYATHTNLDAAKGGVNDVLAARWVWEDVTRFPEGLPGTGAWPGLGVLDAPMVLKDFAEKVKEDLGADHLDLS